MTSTPTPPAVPAADRRRGAVTAIVVATAVAGGIALAAVGISTAVRALAPDPYDYPMAETDLSGPVGDFTAVYEPHLEGLESVSIDAAAASFAIRFADVEEAELRVENSAFAGEWSMLREGDELVVEHPDISGGGVTQGCLFACSGNPGWAGDVTLTLPQRLADDGRLDADIALAGGELRGEGRFAELDLDVSAGSVEFTGAARILDLSLKAGDATVELDDVDEAALDMQAGDATVTLAGSAPRVFEASVQMSDVTVRLPEEEYRVEIDGAAADIDNRLASNDESKHLVRVQASAADVTLR